MYHIEVLLVMITLSIVGEFQRFGGTYYLHLQDRSGLSGQVAAQLTRTSLQRATDRQDGLQRADMHSSVNFRTADLQENVMCDPADTRVHVLFNKKSVLRLFPR
jgi:hypothetical protein